MKDKSIHADPEFATFTYGDPTPPKAGLHHLEKGDMLVFYCGLEGWGFESKPALYLMGYFEVLTAGKASDFDSDELRELFGENFHVRHQSVFGRQKDRLVLVKCSTGSRLLEWAVSMSEVGREVRGRALKVLSPATQEVFGDFKGKVSFQRSPIRWVDGAHVARAACFIRSLE